MRKEEMRAFTAFAGQYMPGRKDDGRASQYSIPVSWCSWRSILCFNKGCA
jgi:hypothetical protein